MGVSRHQFMVDEQEHGPAEAARLAAMTPPERAARLRELEGGEAVGAVLAVATEDADGKVTVREIDTRTGAPPVDGAAQMDALLRETVEAAEQGTLTDEVLMAALRKAVADDPSLLRCFTPERARELGLVPEEADPESVKDTRSRGSGGG